MEVDNNLEEVDKLPEEVDKNQVAEDKNQVGEGRLQGAAQRFLVEGNLHMDFLDIMLLAVQKAAYRADIVETGGNLVVVALLEEPLLEDIPEVDILVGEGDIVPRDILEGDMLQCVLAWIEV